MNQSYSDTAKFGQRKRIANQPQNNFSFLPETKMSKSKHKINPLLRFLGKLFYRYWRRLDSETHQNLHNRLIMIQMGSICCNISVVDHLLSFYSHNFIVTGISIIQVCIVGKITFQMLTCQFFSGYNMLQTNYGSPPLHLSNQTKNGETNIFKEIPDMKILCLRGTMF